MPPRLRPSRSPPDRAASAFQTVGPRASRLPKGLSVVSRQRASRSRVVFLLQARMSSGIFPRQSVGRFRRGARPEWMLSGASSRTKLTSCASRAAWSAQRCKMTAHVLTRASSNHGSALLSKIAWIRKLLKTHSCKSKPYSTSSQLDETRKPNQPPSFRKRVAAGQK